MDTDLEKLEKFPSLKITTKDSSSSLLDAEIEEDPPRYTSLKDLILSSSSSSAYRSLFQEGGNNISNSHDQIDYSKIIIRNRLVKSAASAYLQSAAILVINRNENCLYNLWGKIKNNLETTFSCWNVYFRGPFESCFGAISQFLACTLGGAWGRMFGYQEETLINFKR